MTIEEIQAIYGDPEMEVCEHTAAEMRTLLFFSSDPFVGNKRWACHRDGHVWMGHSAEEAMSRAAADFRRGLT